MDVGEVVGDSQQGDALLELGAALATPPPSNQPGSPLAQVAGAGSQGRSQGATQQQQEQQGSEQEAATPGGGGGGVAALSAAARAFVSECRDRGAEPHPQLLRDLNQLPDEAYARVAPFVSPGQGGAVLGLPPDAAPEQATALVALVAGRGPPPAGGATSDPHFLRTVHLDLSGHPGAAELLPEVLLEGPHRVGQGGCLAGLALQGCQLPPGTLGRVFFDWRFLKAASHLRWLLLADNPLLGRAPAPTPPGPSQAADTQASAGGFLPPARLLPLQWRIFAAAPLRLLDIRNTGFSDAALGYLMRQLARYPSPLAATAAPVGPAPRPEAPAHAGCRATLECLKLGPPADGGHLSEATVACLAQVLQAAPQLQAVEVLGLSPDGREALLAAWQAAQQQRGRAGHLVEAPDGAVRFALSADSDAPVEAEQLPAVHQALQPPTPPPVEPLLLELDAVEVDVAQQGRAWLDGGETQQPAAWPQLQERITAYVARGPQEGRERRQQPRVPGAPPARLAGGAAADGRPQQHGGYAANEGRAGEPRGGGQGGGGERAAAAAGGGQRRRRAPGEQQQARRRRRTGAGGGSTPVHRGSRADELPQYGDACLSEDDEMDDEMDYYLATDEEASTPGGSSSSGDEGGRPASRARGGGGAQHRFCASDDEHSSLSDHPGYDSDQWMSHYRKTLKSKLEQLKRKDPAAGEVARRCFITWNHADNAFDRRRWVNPSRDQEDMAEHIDALVNLKELFESHGIRWHFPLPRSKRAEAAERRRRKRREEQREEQVRGAAAPTVARKERQQQEARPHKRLRKQAELEAAALEDSQEADDEGGGAAARHAAQRRGTQRVVLMDSESSEGEEGESGSEGEPLAGHAGAAGSASPPPAQQQQAQQGANPATPPAAPAVPSQVARAAAAEVEAAVAAAMQQRLVLGTALIEAAEGPPGAEAAAASEDALGTSPAGSIIIPDSEEEQDY